MTGSGYINAAGIAQACGMSVRHANRLAILEGWEYREINKRGDREFYVPSIPEKYRVKIIQFQEPLYNKGIVLPLREDISLGQAKTLLNKFDSAPAWSRRKAEARGEIVDAFDRLARGANSKPLEQVKHDFIRRYNFGNNHLGISSQTYETVDKISRGTLDRWRSVKKTFGLAGLLESSRNREQFGSLTPEMQHYIIGILTKRIHTRPSRVYDYLKNKFEGPDVCIPSGSTVRRFISDWQEKNASLVAYLKNPDKWRSDFQAAFTDVDEKAKYYLHMLEFDNTPADVMCADGNRYTITGAIDIFSRKAKCQVVPTARAQAVANLMRWIILNWGMFDVAVMDNGQDYASKHIEAACGALGTTIAFAPPFTPEAKPHIERFFGTLSTMLFEELSGYIGHSVADRKAIESQKSFAQRMFGKDEVIECRMMPDELQAVIDSWIDNIYHQRIHSSLGKSPEAKAGESKQPVKKILDERVLDILLSPVGHPTVLKKGIHYQSGVYVAPELADYIKEKVQIRRDLADAGKLYVFDMHGGFICIAKDNSLEGLTVEEVNEAKNRQKKNIREQVKALKALAKEIPDPMMGLLESRRNEPGRTFGFRREEVFENNAIREASKAVIEPEPNETFEAEAVISEDSSTRDTADKVFHIHEGEWFNSKLERYKYCLNQQKIRTLTEREKGFMDGYEGTDEYYKIFVMPYR